MSANKSMVRGSVLSLVRLVTGIVRVKILALALGASGVGVYALLLQLYLTGLPIVSMGLAVPIINLGRPLIVGGDIIGAGRVAGTALAMVGFNSIILGICAVLFGDQLLQQMGVGSIDPTLLWPIGAAIVFGAVAGAFWEGVSYLVDRFDIYVRVGIAAAIAEMVFIGLGAWLYGLPGAIYGMPAGPIVLFAANALLLGREPTARKVLANLSTSIAELPRLLTYSAMMFGAGALINIGLTAARAKVLVEAGAAANGYLQTVTSMSAYILSFVTSGFYGHLHARAAAAGDTAEVREELNKALRLALIMIFTGCGAAAMLAEYIIPLFFSGEFRPAADLMIAYMPGELCYQLLVLLMGYQLTISRRRRYLAWGLGYIGMMTAIAMIAIPELGAAGYVLAHVAASLLMLCVATFISYRTGQVTASMVGSIAALAILLALMAAMLLYPPGGLRWLAQLIVLVPVALTGVVTLKALFARQKEA